MAQIVELQSPERPGEEVLPSDVPTEDQLPDEASQETEKPLEELSDEEFGEKYKEITGLLSEAHTKYNRAIRRPVKEGLKDKFLRSISRGRRRGKEDREDGDYEKDPEKIYVEAMDLYRNLLVERKRRLVETIGTKLDGLEEDDKRRVTELIEEMKTDMISALEKFNNEKDPNKRFNHLTSINKVNRRVVSNELIKRILKT